jgi:capsular exopolysaccharide synthesis family protein
MSKIHEALKKAAGVQGQRPGEDVPAAPAEAATAAADTGLPDTNEREQSRSIPPLPFNLLRAYRLETNRGLVTEHEPKSVAAEQFRTLRTRIQRLAADRPKKLVLVTSPGAGDGKTLVSSNLSLSLAQGVDCKVLLMDCDLRRPFVHRFLNLPNEEQPGLHEYLTGQVPLERAIWRVGGTSLHVLTSGPVPDNPSELLGSRRMEQTLRYLTSQFDYVVLDAPPLNPVADPSILIPLADGVLTVVRYGRTGRVGLTKALEAIPAEKVLGLVFNAAELRFSGYYYSYEYAEQ